MKPSYIYRGVVVSNYDGDTLTANVDLGFHCWVHKVKFRLSSIDAPELKEPTLEAGRLSQKALEAFLPAGAPVVVVCHGRDKYGRWLADLYNAAGLHVNQAMVQMGHAHAV